MLFFQGVLTCFMVTVMFFDLTRYLIPNWLVGLMLALYPVMLVMTPLPVDWLYALLIAAGVFAGGLVIFAKKWMGGGDIKLLIVCALWAGTGGALELLLYTGVLGGVLSLGLWLLRPAIAWYASRRPAPPVIPRLFTIGEPVPYGLAIASAFLIILWMGKIPGLSG